MIWRTKYPYRIVTGRVVWSVRDLTRQVWSARRGNRAGTCIARPHPFTAGRTPLGPAKLAQYIRTRSPRQLHAEFSDLRSGSRASICGARLILRPVGAVDEALSKLVLKNQSGMKMMRNSRLPHPPSLSRLSSGTGLRRLQPHPTTFSPQGFSRLSVGSL
jgi:hypothetical protein